MIPKLVAAALEDDERRNGLPGLIVEQDSAGRRNLCGHRKRHRRDPSIEQKFFVLMAGGCLHRERSCGGFASSVVTAVRFFSGKVRTEIRRDGDGIPGNAAIVMRLIESIGDLDRKAERLRRGDTTR